jgi:hypothetical protein
MGNIKPVTSITVTDPKLFEEIAKVKADTEAIKTALQQEKPAATEAPRYFPRGYFP